MYHTSTLGASVPVDAYGDTDYGAMIGQSFGKLLEGITPAIATVINPNQPVYQTLPNGTQVPFNQAAVQQQQQQQAGLSSGTTAALIGGAVIVAFLLISRK